MKLTKIILFTILISIGAYKNDEIENRDNAKNYNDEKFYDVIKIDSVQHIYLVYLERNDSIFKVMSNKALNKDCDKIKTGNRYTFMLNSWFKPEEIHLKYRMAGVKIGDAYIKIERDSNVVCDLFLTKNLKGLCYIENLE